MERSQIAAGPICRPLPPDGHSGSGMISGTGVRRSAYRLGSGPSPADRDKTAADFRGPIELRASSEPQPVASMIGITIAACGSSRPGSSKALLLSWSALQSKEARRAVMAETTPFTIGANVKAHVVTVVDMEPRRQ